uniref:Uncharacterized protein n=1 Tax=Chromera velia CCMP2878 TaxID=1169474 RepID=A0A0G4GS12_9ALVE|eukprot:Cvel_5130.t1-p1 / transcript=Cvel_5130.t1 / gene=Cvel_5130 / organism=Chromera_velia_CCMP2878 / gene_product=hypothetical protein / transcript_product=hypothetical protein / location=Cvel_scaffold234:108601-109485(-) / protein_length=295 / sequence_SO=supercontig / SO=protein_coding / is_pseudo=false
MARTDPCGWQLFESSVSKLLSRVCDVDSHTDSLTGETKKRLPGETVRLIKGRGQFTDQTDKRRHMKADVFLKCRSGAKLHGECKFYRKAKISSGEVAKYLQDLQQYRTKPSTRRVFFIAEESLLTRPAEDMRVSNNILVVSLRHVAGSVVHPSVLQWNERVITKWFPDMVRPSSASSHESNPPTASPHKVRPPTTSPLVSEQPEAFPLSQLSKTRCEGAKAAGISLLEDMEKEKGGRCSDRGTEGWRWEKTREDKCVEALERQKHMEKPDVGVPLSVLGRRRAESSGVCCRRCGA